MRIALIAVGRARDGPEAALTAEYLARFDKTGRALGLGPARVDVVEDRRGRGAEAEGALLLDAAPKGAFLLALDERGRAMTSPGFAELLAGERDGGRRDFAILIGGADGLSAAAREAADRRLSLGPMIWPHLLARAMIAEQLYRAASILAGAPYHRG